ncbi:MAG: hypothetical protein ABFD79_10230 [Phycisphaerales bacterium]
MSRMLRRFMILLAAAWLPAICGCNIPKEQLIAFNKYYEASDFNSALIFAETKIKKGKNPSGEDLLWALQAASIKRDLQDYNASTQFFDNAENHLKYYDTRSSIGDEISAVAVNDNIMPYKGAEYDGVMTNTYKALNFLCEKKSDLARVEFNRAIDRLRRTKEKFENEISKQKENINKATYSNLAQKSIDSNNFQKALCQNYPQLNEYQPYKDYINPFVTYVASIYFNSVGEPAIARDLLKETHGLVPANKYVEEEFKKTDELLSQQDVLKNSVWVIYENGLGPVKDEFRIDLPLFIATSRVLYAGIALPKLTNRDIAFSCLQINADANMYETAVVCDMEKIIQSEFKKDFEIILIRTIISATAKAVAQYAVSQQDSTAATVGTIMIAAYSFVTTAADVRIWTALPKEFQIAQFDIPQNKTITITPFNGQPFDIELPDSEKTIIYIKIINKNTKPIYNVIPL